jgi:hypothetical protein
VSRRVDGSRDPATASRCVERHVEHDAALLAATQASADPSAGRTLELEVVYVKPAPAPETVVERQTASRSGTSSPSSAAVRPVRLVRAGDKDRWEREDREDREDHDRRVDDDEHERDDD